MSTEITRLEELARLARQVAEASGQKWEYAAVVVHLGEGVPDLVPVVVVPKAAPAGRECFRKT